MNTPAPLHTRREFLRHSGSLAAAIALNANAPARAAEPGGKAIPAIDTHTHFYDPTRAEGVPWPQPGDRVLYRKVLPPEFEALSRPHGVVGTVIVEASPWVEDNQWILDLAKHHPSIVGFVGNLPVADADFAKHLARFAADPLFRGLRVGGSSIARGLETPAWVQGVTRLAERDLSLDVVGGPSMLPDVVRLATRVSRLRIVVDHLPFGAWEAELPAMRNQLAPVADCSNVFAKVSDVQRKRDGALLTEPGAYRDRLELLWELFGPDRVIFGSNWPVSDLVGPYANLFRVVAEFVRGRGLADAEKYLWRNSKAAYRWQPRSAATDLR